MPCFLRKFFIWLLMMVSNILFKCDRILIGLKLFILVCTPFLCIGRTFAIFKKFGYSPLLIDRLNNLDSGSAMREAECFRNLAGRSSYPVAF